VNPLRPVRVLYRFVFRRAALERDMREEMGAHLEQAVERLTRRGLSDPDARAMARREFGNVGYLQEEARDVRGGRWLETLARDVRFAFRYFARTPLTAITLVLVLSLGIGVNAALFSILQALMLRPAPARPADESLVRIRGTTYLRTEGSLQSRGLSMPEIEDLATRTGTFAAVAGYGTEEFVFDAGDGSEPRVARGHFVTPNFFATIGVRPVLGPGLPAGRTDDAPGAELVAMIGHRLWEQTGGDTAAIGRIVRLNNVPVRIVGVAPPAFAGPVIESGNPVVWLPIAARATLTRSTAHALASRDSALFDAIGRLTPGTTVEQATAVVRVVATAWGPETKQPDENREHSSDVVALRGFTEVTNDGEAALTIVLVGTGGLLVLLVVCTNVSALLVGAAVARRREVAIRLSLGASRSRIIRQLLTETSLIALAGGALGLTVYWWIITLVVWLLGDVPIGPDLGTVAFTAVAALGTGIIFGLSPALHATRVDVAAALKSAGGGSSNRSRLQRGFIVAQIVLTQPLLVGIAMVVSIVMGEAAGQDRSPLKERIIHVQFGMYGGAGSRSERIERVTDAMKKVAGLPGVEEVMPQAAAFDVGDWRVHTADRGSGPRAEELVRSHLEGAAPGYLTFQNLRMVRGRDLSAADTAGREMAVVIESDLARGFWGAEDPIGKRLEMVSRGSQQEVRAAVVVGVFDTTGTPLRGAGRVYTAHGSKWRRDVYLVRTRGPGAAMTPAIRQLTRAELPDVPIYGNGIATLAQLDRIERNEVMQISAGATAGGLVALLLASIGLYGVVALAVRQRQREIGVRVALGAQPQQVIRMFFMSGVRLSMVGLVLGLPLSVVALYLLASQFAETMPLNMPLVGAAIAATVVGVAALASWIPARRASRVDPMLTLKVE
jgi:putative ABC transport system permease protein